MPKKIMLEVIESRGKGCDQGLKLGDKFELKEHDHHICCLAFSALFPVAQVLRYDGKFPWETEKGVQFIGCPDPYNTIVFRVSAEEIEQ